MIQKSDLPDLTYAGFRIRSGTYVPHVAQFVYEDAQGKRYEDVPHFRDGNVPGILTKVRANLLHNDYYFLTGEDRQDFNNRYTINDVVKVVYIGADTYTGAYHVHDLERRHFVAGTEAEIGATLQNEHWARLTRVWRDAAQFLDLYPNNLRRLEILNNLQDMNVNNTNEYFRLGRMIEHYTLRG